MQRIKIGFVFVSHKAHIHHGAPVAFELSYNGRFDVQIFTSNGNNYELLNQIAERYPDNKCTLHYLKPSKFYLITRYFKNRLYPGWNEIFRQHLDLFSCCDALLSPHYNLDYLMDRFPHIKYFRLLHGAGDNKIGFSPKLSRFDYVLVSGQEIKQRMLVDKLLEEEFIKVVGYPKFDLIRSQVNSNNLFPNSNLIVQYNPHYYKDLTSWYKWGYEILDFFVLHKEYNLVFAPHIKLFGTRIPRKLKKYLKYDNILIDIKSDALIDMTYTQLSHIYLGDVSSQVYEFIQKTRPCVFLNAYNRNWKDDKLFNMWNLGDVVSDLNDFESILSNATINHQNYASLQHSKLGDKFYLSNVTAGKNAANVIAEILLK